MFCFTLLYVRSCFAIILMGKIELVALLSLSSWCLMRVVWVFLLVPWVCLQFVIVVFPDHTHLLFFYNFGARFMLLLLFNSIAYTFIILNLFQIEVADTKYSISVERLVIWSFGEEKHPFKLL